MRITIKINELEAIPVRAIPYVTAWKETPAAVTLKNREAFAHQLKLVGALAFQGVEVTSHWKELVVPSGEAYTATGAARYESDVRSTLMEA